MSSSRGGKRAGAGRPKGARNLYNQEMERLLKERMEELGHHNYDPVVCLAQMGMDLSVPVEIRFKAHAEVAQYVRSKRRFSVVEPANDMLSQISDMSPAEREAKIKVLAERLYGDEGRPSG